MRPILAVIAIAVAIGSAGCATVAQKETVVAKAGPAGKYGVMSAERGAQQAAQATHIAPRPEFDAKSADAIARNVLRKSSIGSVSSRKLSIRSAMEEFGIDSMPFTPDSEIWVATVKGALIWPFADEKNLSPSDRARLRSPSIVLMISPETGGVIRAFQAK